MTPEVEAKAETVDKKEKEKEEEEQKKEEKAQEQDEDAEEEEMDDCKQVFVGNVSNSFLIHSKPPLLNRYNIASISLFMA